MNKQWIVDITSVYDLDERLIKVLDSNQELQTKWLHKMVDQGWVYIIDFYDQKNEESLDDKK